MKPKQKADPIALAKKRLADLEAAKTKRDEIASLKAQLAKLRERKK